MNLSVPKLPVDRYSRRAYSQLVTAPSCRRRPTTPSGQSGRSSLEGRAGDRGLAGAEEEDAGQAVRLEPVALVVSQRGALDAHRPGAVVADEEDRSAALVGVVVLDDGAHQLDREEVAVEVDGAAAAAARGTALRRVGAAADGGVVAHDAVVDGPRDADAAQRAAVGADAALPGGAAERAVHDVDRQVVRLAERADGRAAEVGTGLVAPVADEARVDHLEPAAPVEDRAATATLGLLAGGVAVGERDVLDGELRRLLVLAVRGGPALCRVTGVLVEDAALAAATERDLAATVEHDAGAGVAYLRGLLQGDHQRRRSAVERDDPADPDRGDQLLGGATRRGAVADDPVRVAGVDRLPVGRYRGVAVRVAGPGECPRRRPG